MTKMTWSTWMTQITQMTQMTEWLDDRKLRKFAIDRVVYLSGGGGPTGPNVVRPSVVMLKIAVRLRRTAYSAYIFYIKLS